MQKKYLKFNKKKGWKICISQSFFQFLEQNRSIFPITLEWDKLLLLASKIEYKAAKNSLNYAEIPSEELKYYVRDYSKYIEYLTSIKAIEKKNYSTTLKRCNAFRINYELFNKKLTEIIELEPFLKPKTFSNQTTSCHHLTKWLNSGLKIDYQNYYHSTFSAVEEQHDCRNYKNRVSRVLNYRASLNDLSSGYFRANRDPKTDNRLHTNLTNFPSKLRQFITYNDWDLVAYDIKNSQPYFLVVFIEGFEEVRINRIYKSIYGNKSIMSDRIHKSLYCKDFQEEYSQLKDLILSGKLYEFLMNVLHFKTEKNDYLIKAYNKETDKSYHKKINNKRDACKQTFMQILYSPNQRKSKQYKQFEEKFPKFCELLNTLKRSSNRKEAYKKFPKLLQHIEADCVLDFLTKRIAKEHPAMPIFTIHDSIITIEAFSDTLYNKMKQYLSEYSKGVLPQLKQEYWGLNYTKIKEAV